MTKIIEESLSLNDRLALISLIDKGMRQGDLESPVMTDLFSGLWELVDATVSGSKIDRLKPKDSQNGFQVFEINTESGENLGYLNMLYLKKPISCYYLVYVEVAPPFRRKGLGNRILKYFRDFLIKKSAIGILDNIIPKNDPVFDIYSKQGWEPAKAVIGNSVTDRQNNYMVYIPLQFKGKDLKEPIKKLLYHLEKKREAINMRDNEVMVQQTIAEFKDLYFALLKYFESEICEGKSSLLMRFMFTRFVTKFIAFRRRIGNLLGYTGGESLEQITLTPEIDALPVQSYIPIEFKGKIILMDGNKEIWSNLPRNLKENPARFIELLPNYRRPSLIAWLSEQKFTSNHILTLGDLMDLGFDPTRLKEMFINGKSFIIERIQTRQLPELERKRVLLKQIASKTFRIKIENVQLKINPPLLAIQERGNAYVLRRKINGIHWEEAIEQLHSTPRLKALNTSLKLDKMIFNTVRKVSEVITEHLDIKEKTFFEQLAYFVSWDLKNNMPKTIIDFTISLESVWLA